jgi:hypothetical protein
MKICFLYLLLFFASMSLAAQSVTNVVSRQLGNNAVITYDLNGSEGETYLVNLFYSTDGGVTYSTDLVYVTGDVKNGVTAGLGKKIIWAAAKEVTTLSGAVMFKVVCELSTVNTLPKSKVLDTNTIEILSAKHVGIELIVEFVFTQHSDDEVKLCSVLKRSKVIDHEGRTFFLNSGVFGSGVVGSSSGEIKCTKGVPVKGYLSFILESYEKIVPLLEIDLNMTTDSHTFIFNNIPVE